MKFSKLQATGNDFILVDAITQALCPEGRRLEDLDWAGLARVMCDRHFGIGADGLILVERSAVADLKMRVFNSDGSEAEACGNGLRCFAKYAIERGMAANPSAWPEAQGVGQAPCEQDTRFLTIETLSGTRRAKAYLTDGKVTRVEVDMGLPRFGAEEIPIKLDVPVASEPILNYPLIIDGSKLTLALLSMGNPHAVTFLSQPVADFPLARIGAKVEVHTMFPKRTNFEVARVLSKGKIEARVWERGVGETLACGSGACAILGYTNAGVDITLPGGTLTVRWDGAGEVTLSGPVKEVFSGEWLRDSD